MATIRRWYVLLVCGVSLHATAWAAIALVRGLLRTGTGDPIAAVALQVAIIVIGLPIFIAHWLWAQRLAANDVEERGSDLRRFYLYVTLAALFAPMLANAFTAVHSLLRLIASETDPIGWLGYTNGELIARSLVALVLLGLLWWYHRRVLQSDQQALPTTALAASFERLYRFGFSTVGLIMVAGAATDLLHWLLLSFGAGAPSFAGQGLLRISSPITRIAVGLPLWLIFWGQAQRRFQGAASDEHESLLRKIYLYATVFVTVLSTVSNATFLLSGLLQRLLGLNPDGDARGPLAVIVVGGIIWAYHARVLSADARQAPEVPRQVAVGRIYRYLVAAIGLAALLVGVGGVLSVLIRAVAEGGFNDMLSEQLAWFSAALIAGAPVWLWPWRQIRAAAAAAPPAGAAERRALVRKLYLYAYLFAATMTVLIGAIYIVARLVRLLLGDPLEGNLLSDLGQALAFTTLGVGAWLYHGSELRADSRAEAHDRTARLAGLRIAVIDPGDGTLGQALVTGLQHELPGLALELVLPAAGVAALAAAPAQIEAAGLLIGPWSIAGEGPGGLPPALAQLVAASPARKLLLLHEQPGWEWVGVEPAGTPTLVRETVRAVVRIGAGEPPERTRNASTIIGVIVGVIIIIPILIQLLTLAIGGLFF